MKRPILFGLLISFLYSGHIFAQDPTGFVKFKFNVDSAYVVRGVSYFDLYKVASEDSLQFNDGTQILKLFTPVDKSGSIYVKVVKDSTITLTHTFNTGKITPESIDNNVAARYYFDANVMVLSDEDSKIFYNGEHQGTGFAKFNTFGNLGELEIKNPDFGQTKRRLNVPDQRVNFIRKDLRPVKSISRFYSIFPGASQLYKKQHLKAALFGTTTVALFTYAGIKSSEYHKELDVFNEYQENYDNAATEQDALRLGDIAESQQNNVQRLDNQRKYLLLTGLLIYGYNIYDAFISKPAGGYAKNDKNLEFYLSQEQVSGITKTSGTLRYNF